MRDRRPAICWTVFVVSLACSSLAAADPAADDATRAEARERFSRGLHLFENGDNGGALAEFNRAYALIPNRLVLYNVGLVYVAMDRPVEAVDTLEKVLQDPGSLNPEQVARARAAKDEQAQRIGAVDIKTNVPATIEVDGLQLGHTPLDKPLRVATGSHVIAGVAPGYLPIRRELMVAGGMHVEVSMDLQTTESRLAHIEVRCQLPGADVLVDGALVGKTPLAASVTTAPGAHVIEVKRSAYITQRRELVLQDGARGEVAFDPDPDPNVAPSSLGRLRLAVDEGEILVAIDGRAQGVYRESLLLPEGPHTLKLERAGFEPIARTISVPAAGEVLVKADLRPTPETREAYVAHARSYRFWSYVTLFGGLAIGAGSGGLAIWSHSQISGAQNELTSAQNDAVRFGGGGCDPSKALATDKIAACNQRISNAQNSISTDRTLRTVGIIGAATGVAVAGLGLTLLIISPNPTRYDRHADETLASRSPRLLPVVVAGPDGASVLLSGSF
ncbi:MAG TPA: PEGA domain-containing protein [Polyangia bacterium]|jgi:PEGA domain.|nr:PEGA domain-containing protein [Polyangia bacterium]